mmetsp:Transcript_26239/g.44253  ORF Transcript_26239/g.44253 Transcript_26239/m.44253 type:complete len:363 (-) Transcript_26239:507-1595(-)
MILTAYNVDDTSVLVHGRGRLQNCTVTSSRGPCVVDRVQGVPFHRVVDIRPPNVIVVNDLIRLGITPLSTDHQQSSLKVVVVVSEDHCLVTAATREGIDGTQRGCFPQLAVQTSPHVLAIVTIRPSVHVTASISSTITSSAKQSTHKASYHVNVVVVGHYSVFFTGRPHLAHTSVVSIHILTLFSRTVALLVAGAGILLRAILRILRIASCYEVDLRRAAARRHQLPRLSVAGLPDVTLISGDLTLRGEALVKIQAKRLTTDILDARRHDTTDCILFWQTSYLTSTATHDPEVAIQVRGTQVTAGAPHDTVLVLSRLTDGGIFQRLAHHQLTAQPVVICVTRGRQQAGGDLLPQHFALHSRL